MLATEEKKFEPTTKAFDPHVVVWINPATGSWLAEKFPYREDAEIKYFETCRITSTVILAKVVRTHSEG